MGPKFFGKTGNWRFDSPNKDYGTLYAAMSEQACFVETLLRGLNSFVAQSELDIRSLCSFRVIREIRLVRAYGPHLNSVGASSVVTSTSDYEVCQRWSQKFHSHPDAPDGILYRSNYDNDELALVLFNRAEAAIDAGSSKPIMSDTGLLGKILNRYKASIR